MTLLRTLAVLALVSCGTPDADTDPDTDVVAEPGPLQAGFARVRIPAPLGIGTAGFGPTGAPSSDTPFSEIYPGTTSIMGHPEMKVMVVSRGEGFEAVFLRVDAVGMFAQLRREIVLAAEERLGRDLDDAILIGATHTHSGPGRVLNTGSEAGSLFDLIVDRFFPEFYEAFVTAAVDAIEAAFEDLEDARLGTVMATCAEAHDDRRCDDGQDYTNDNLPMLVVERDGRIEGLLMSYAIHGTVYSIDELLLSRDVSGAIEQAVEARFDHPVEAILFNSWAADMSPSGAESAELATGAEVYGEVQRLWRVGSVMADAVDEAVPDITWHEEPEIDLLTQRIPIDRDLVGYDSTTFPYDHGAVFCGLGADSSCDDIPPERVDGLDKSCLPFTEGLPAPTQVDVTTGRIGDFAVVTFPGEPGTILAEQIMDGLRARHDDVKDVLFLGYTQDYLGYAILEDDWWFGGYEASGSLWGPKQGAYLARRVGEAYDAWADGTTLPDARPALEPFPYAIRSTYEPETAVEPNTIVDDVQATYAPTDSVQFTVRGQNPWLGAPLARILDADGEPVAWGSGKVVDSDGYEFHVSLQPDPPYVDADDDNQIDRVPRTFAWTFTLPIRSPLPEGIDLTEGAYTIAVEVPQPDGSTVTVTSSTFGTSAD